MITTVKNKDLILHEIEDLLHRTDSTNLRPQHAILKLLTGHFTDWAVLLQLREEIISESDCEAI